MPDRRLVEVAVLFAAGSGYIVALYCLVLLRWYRPRDGRKFARTKLGPVTSWLDHHPFVPFPIALGILLVSLGVMVSSPIGRAVLLVGAGACAIATCVIAVHDPQWVSGARAYFASEASYVPGRAERVEWAATGVFVIALVGGYLAAAGISPASVGAMIIVLGVGLRQVAKGGKRRPRV